MGKTSKTARQIVNDKLEEASKSTSQNSSKAPVTPSKSTSKSKNLSIISAAAAVYRSQNAPQEKPFTPSAEQQKIFAETQKKLADEKGISANDLSPLDIMKSATFDYYKETQNNDTASNDVQVEIAEVYDNNPENPEPAPEAVTSVNKNVNITFIPDFEFLTLNEDQQKKWCRSYLRQR